VKPVLHGYFRSSAAYRVRIALALKGLEVQPVFHHLRKGEQQSADYLALNPQGLLPTLETPDGAITQSLAIIEYLDETIAGAPLLPEDAMGRARVRSLAQAVACDIHPIDNLRVLNYLRNEIGVNEAAVQQWFNHWIAIGFAAIETRLVEPQTGQFMHGDTPTLADICLIPQVTNARNFDLDLAPFPRIQRIFAAAMALPAFAGAAPSQQPDAE
jgi:maleylacetoacetate isomerase